MLLFSLLLFLVPLGGLWVWLFKSCNGNSDLHWYSSDRNYNHLITIITTQEAEGQARAFRVQTIRAKIRCCRSKCRHFDLLNCQFVISIGTLTAYSHNSSHNLKKRGLCSSQIARCNAEVNIVFPESVLAKFVWFGGWSHRRFVDSEQNRLTERKEPSLTASSTFMLSYLMLLFVSQLSVVFNSTEGFRSVTITRFWWV